MDATPVRAMQAATVGALLVYVVGVTLLWGRWELADGPLTRDAAEQVDPSGVGAACADVLEPRDDQTVERVTGTVDGRELTGCFRISDSGSVFEAALLEGTTNRTNDWRLVQRAGMWPHVGLVKYPWEAALGAAGIVGMGLLMGRHYLRPHPSRDTDAPGGRGLEIVAIIAGSVLFGMTSWIVFLLPRRDRQRKGWLFRSTLIVTLGVVTFAGWDQLQRSPDPVGVAALGGWVAAYVLLLVVGRAYALPRVMAVAAPAPSPPPPDPAPAPQAAQPAAARPARSQDDLGRRPSGTATPVITPERLPTFSDVGGMESLKEEIDSTVGLIMAFEHEAEQLGIDFGGILLHGIPGTGKTFIARATAGEYGLNLVAVSVADTTGRFVGDGPEGVRQAFATAAANLPALLLFDEFDSIATSRDGESIGGLSEESRRTVNQLLQEIETFNEVPSLIVMATTNYLDRLDAAVIRPGRFDRLIRVDLPDHAGRAAILEAQLAARATTDDIDLADLADRTEGFTPATLAAIVDEAALTALRDTAAAGTPVAISHAHLRGALAARGGKDRPTVEAAGLDQLVLSDRMRREVQQLVALLADPDAAARYGIEAPSGLLLAGPPGTGKTSIGRALAAEAGCSFYPITAADVTSMWVGQSEKRVQALFARARDNAPSIVFIDEIDSIAGRRAGFGNYSDKVLNQLLTEIDGLDGRGGVFVMAATNRPDVLDPALVRGGRLSRTLWVGLPDHAERVDLLELFSAPMPLAADVSLDSIAAATDGMSGADLEALCQQAAVEAMISAADATSADPASVPDPEVDAEAFRVALTALRADAEEPAVDPAELQEAVERLTQGTSGYL